MACNGSSATKCCDLLVVGSGASGLACAVTAAWHGLEVVLVEKEPLIGGATARSGGCMWVAGSPGSLFAGLKTNEHAQVLGHDGPPITGPYAVGTAMASVMRGFYPSGDINPRPAMTFGYIAGRDAAGAHDNNSIAFVEPLGPWHRPHRVDRGRAIPSCNRPHHSTLMTLHAMRSQAKATAISCLCLLVIAALAGCKGHPQVAAAVHPEAPVLEIRTEPVTVHEEYVAQTQSPETIEIRSQVTGLLQRQAFADGARVKKGDLLYVIDQRPVEAQLAQAKASLAQAEANLVNAQQNLARNSRLIAQRAVSQQDYDSALAQERSSAALVDAQKAVLRNVELNLEFSTLRAPRDGFMTSSLVKPGALITAQQTLLTTLYSNDPMWVNFTISEDRLLALQKDLKRSPGERLDTAPPFHIRLADGQEYALAGKLDFIDATIDQRSGTLQLRVSVPNPQRLLRPGLFVRVIVARHEIANGIRVPQKAVQELQGLKSVLVVGPDDKIEARPIVARYRLANDWVVDSGLAAGDRVVVEGTGKLRPGATVRPVSSKAP